MKLVGGLILWGWIAALFFRWNRDEELAGADAPVWQDLEAELHRTRSTKP